MNFNKNTFNLTRKQGIAIAVILATGIVAGTWILGGSTSQPAGEQHEHASHAEAKGHADASPMLTQTVSFAELPGAFEALRKPTDQCKILIDPNAV